VRTVGALLVRDPDEILFGLRAPWKKAWAGHWDAIGGHVEDGEGPLDALVREVQEEIGVTPTDFELLESVPESRPDLHGQSIHEIYAVTAWSGGDPTNACDEHTEIRWFPVAALPALKLAGAGYPRLAGLALQRWQRRSAR
jgi:mutator protein MutT